MNADKRWQDGRQRWVAPGRVFDRSRFSVDVLPDLDRPKDFCRAHHYSATIPPVHMAIGLFGPGARLCGTAVFTVRTRDAVAQKYGGPIWRRVCELGRFVLTPDVAYNGETWFLARAFRLFLREYTKTRLDVVVSFADPVEWRHGSTVIKPEHWGTIYQASNAIFPTSQPGDRTDFIPATTGRPFAYRAIQKIRQGEVGRGYATRQLIEAGLPARNRGESPRAWIDRLERIGALIRRRHPGNLAYVFGLTDEARATLRSHLTPQPYPKRSSAA